MKFMRKITMLSISFALISSAMATSTDEEAWSLKLVNHFEMYCFRTGANFSTITSMAEALELQEIPQKMLVGMMPINDVEDGKGYVLEHDEESSKGIMLMAVRGQDACSVIGANLGNESAVEYVLKEYQLVEFFKDDVGLQVTNLYIPGGDSESYEEVRERGVIYIVKSKPGSPSKGMTIGYLPPITAKEIY